MQVPSAPPETIKFTHGPHAETRLSLVHDTWQRIYSNGKQEPTGARQSDAFFAFLRIPFVSSSFTGNPII